MSPIDGEKPVFRAEKAAFGWEWSLPISCRYDKILISDGKSVEFFDRTQGVDTRELSGGVAVAVTRGDQVVSMGASGIDADKKAFERALETPYDDEAIATENYFEAHYEQKNENAHAQNDDNPREKGEKGLRGAIENDEAVGAHQEPPSAANAPENDDRAASADKTSIGYGQRVASNIAALFASGEDFPALSSVIPFSRWTKIRSGDKTYYFGVQYVDHARFEAAYFCYAVEGKSGFLPDGLNDAVFFPENYFATTDKGYYISFQSALCGKPAIK